MTANATSRDKSIFCPQGPEQLTPTQTGVLSGKQFVFKDLFDVSGYVTGAGNPTWLATHLPASATSPLISRLLASGAACVGRVQTDELAYSLNGQNVHYGTPTNPVAPDCIPGGSSSGSAVCVANGTADFALGTDTGGSVRVPASYCGIYGLRPTFSGLDLAHSFTLAKRFDTAGLFARDVGLLAQVFSLLGGQNSPVETVKTLYLDNTLAALLSDARKDTLDQWCENAGITIASVDFLADTGWTLDALSEVFRTVQGYEIIAAHDAWLAEHGHTLDAAIQERVMWSRNISQEQYEATSARQETFKTALLSTMQNTGGVWLVPTTPSGPPSLTMPAEELAVYRSQLMGLTSMAGLAGLPQLHLPMHNLAEGPCGISLMGLANTESTLFAVAQHFQTQEQR